MYCASLLGLHVHNIIIIATVKLFNLFREAGVRQIKLAATCIHD